MKALSALLLICLAAACSQAIPPADGTAPPSAPSTAPPTAPPSPSPSPIETVAPEIVDAARMRHSFGLRSDIEWVIAVQQDPASAMSELGFLVTPQEEAELQRRFANQDRLEGLHAYGAANPDTFAGMYIDQAAGGTVVLMFTDDLARHREALAAITPPGLNVQLRTARHTEAELIELIESLDFEALRREGYELNSAGLDTIANVVRIEARSDLPDAKRRLEGRFGGRLVADIHPLPGAWANRGAGRGWRLLATGETSAAEAYVVGVATDDGEWAELWQRLGLEGEVPAVDFEQAIVATFGHGIGSSCRELRLDDVVIDEEASLVYSLTSDPLAPRACTADLVGAVVFVVALERGLLPASPFSVQLREQIFDCEGCTERVEVELDD